VVTKHFLTYIVKKHLVIAKHSLVYNVECLVATKCALGLDIKKCLLAIKHASSFDAKKHLVITRRFLVHLKRMFGSC